MIPLPEIFTEVLETEDGTLVDLLDSQTSNVFCPTGQGGGVDATCSPGKGDAKEGKVGATQEVVFATLAEHAFAVAKAREKLETVPEPTAEEVEESRLGLTKLGANKYRRNLVGNTTDRRRRREKLLKEFGDGNTCPCVYCGLKIGEGTLEQDKIKTTAEGGRYRVPNLVPACGDCNKRRGDKKFRDALKKVVAYAGPAP